MALGVEISHWTIASARRKTMFEPSSPMYAIANCFFTRNLKTRATVSPQGRFSFFAPSCVLGATCFTILKNSRERERFNSDYTNASKIREDERRRTRCIAKKKEKKKKLETKTRWTKMNLKRMDRGWKNNAKKKKKIRWNAQLVDVLYTPRRSVNVQGKYSWRIINLFYSTNKPFLSRPSNNKCPISETRTSRVGEEEKRNWSRRFIGAMDINAGRGRGKYWTRDPIRFPNA